MNALGQLLILKLAFVQQLVALGVAAKLQTFVFDIAVARIIIIMSLLTTYEIGLQYLFKHAVYIEQFDNTSLLFFKSFKCHQEVQMC